MCLSQLLQSGMLVRNKKHADLTSWVFVLGSVEGKAAQEWPAVEVREGLVSYFAPKSGSVRQLTWLPVLALDEWGAQPIEWTPVLSHILQAKDLVPLPEVLRPGVVAFAQGSSKPVLQVSAEGGFQGMGSSALKELAVLIGCEVVAAPSVFDLLKALAQHSAPNVGDNDLVAILHKRRIPHSRVVDGFWKQDTIMECFDSSDQGVVSKYTENNINIDTNSDEMQGAYGILQGEGTTGRRPLRHRRRSSRRRRRLPRGSPGPSTLRRPTFCRRARRNSSSPRRPRSS